MYLEWLTTMSSDTNNQHSIEKNMQIKECDDTLHVMKD